MSKLEFEAAQPNAPDSIVLIEELDALLTPQYPQENRHGYSVQKLIEQEVLFFVVRCDGQLAGCGGIQLFGDEYGELKRMYVRPDCRGNGIGRALLNHLAGVALAHRVQTLRLETGIYQVEAIGLYESWGFQRRDPFGDYQTAPLSLFYEKRITPSDS